MKTLGFGDDEVVALAMLRSFGVVDTTSNYYRDHQFNNTYFKNLISLGQADKNIRLETDEFLLSDPGYKHHVKKFADDEAKFFRVFERAFGKMTRIGYQPKQLSDLDELFKVCEIRVP